MDVDKKALGTMQMAYDLANTQELEGQVRAVITLYDNLPNLAGFQGVIDGNHYLNTLEALNSMLQDVVIRVNDISDALHESLGIPAQQPPEPDDYADIPF